MQQVAASRAAHILYTSCASSHQLSQWEQINFRPAEPSPGGRQGLHRQKEKAVVLKGSGAIEIWTRLLGAAPDEHGRWDACSLLPAWPTAGPLEVLPNCWLQAEWPRQSSDYRVRLRRTGCHIQPWHCCFTRRRGKHRAQEHGHGDLAFCVEAEEEI